MKRHSIFLIFTTFVVLSSLSNVARAQFTATETQQKEMQLVDSFPSVGTFWSAQLFQPPLPYNPFPQWSIDLPVYAYDLSNHIYVIDDRSIDYPALWKSLKEGTAYQPSKSSQTSEGMSTMEAGDEGPPLPPEGEGGGGGGGEAFFSYTPPPGLKITPPVVTNGNLTVSIYEHNPAIPYDIYYTTNLNSPILWNLAATGIVGQTNYTVLGVWGTATNAFFIAASGADVDGDGLKDGNEALIRKTDPFNADTDGDGMSDGWEVGHGLNPLIPNQPYTPPATTLTITKPTSGSLIQ